MALLAPIEIGRRIRAARLKKSLTQYDLADRAGLTQSAISQYERGIRTPRHSYCSRLASALDVPVHQLLLD